MTGSEVRGRLRRRTSDLDAAHHYVVEAFSEHEVVAERGDTVDFDLDLVPSPRLVIGKMSYGAEVALHGPPIEFAYHINIPDCGTSSVAQHGDRRDFVAGQAGVVFTPHHPVRIHWSQDCRQHHVQVPKRHFEAHASKVIGRPVAEPIRFNLTFDLSSDAGRALQSTARFLYHELSRPEGIAALPSVCYELESAFMTQAIMTIPHQFTDLVRASATGPRRAKIRQAIDYVEEHVAVGLTTVDVAAALRISERSLQAGFREHVGMTPNRYIRGVRLDRAHADLVAGAESVSQIATKWGFHHHGRFAQLYRERFGVVPSAAVARG